MISQAEIAIVGGGIWGLSIALHLARAGRGRKICVIERNSELAAETTLQAAGQVGQLRANPVMARGVRATLDLLAGFKAETGHDPGFCRSGSVHLALSTCRMEAFERQIGPAAAQGIAVEIATPAQLSRLVPALDQRQIAGAIFIPEDGYVDARQFALALGAAAAELGVQILLETTIKGLRAESGELKALDTDRGRIATPCAVIACGPWSARIVAQAGISVAAQPIRLQQARTAANPGLPEHHPVVRIPDQSCYLRPERGGYLYGFFDPDPLAYDVEAVEPSFHTSAIAPPRHVIDEARRRLSPLFPVIDRLPIDQYRQGMVTCSPDGNYLLGPLNQLPGLWIATGCGGMGIAGAGAVGQWLSEWILDGRTREELSAFDSRRFGGQAADPEWVRAASCQTFASYYALDDKNISYSIGNSPLPVSLQ